MAYDANPLKEENLQISPNVLGGQSQQMQQQTVKEPTVPQGGGQSATITPGQQAPAAQPKAPSKKPKSGMSANLRQYIQANRPQTQRIASAATEGSTRQAQEIGSQIASQRQEQQQNIQKADQSRQQAKAATQDILRRASTTGAIGSDEIGRFRNIATGKERFDQVADLDLASQRQGSEALQQRAEQAGTFSGQAQILKDRFQKRGREYTRGQSGLDRLLLAGDESARRSITEGIGQAATQTGQKLTEAQTQSTADLNRLRELNQQLMSNISGQAASGTQQVKSEIDQKLAQEQARRQALVSQLGQEAQATQDFVRQAAVSPEQVNNLIADSYVESLGISQEEFDRMPEFRIINTPAGIHRSPTAKGIANRMRRGEHVEISGDGRTLDKIAQTSVGKLVNDARLRELGYNPEDFRTFDSSYGTGNVNLFGGGGRKMMYTTSPTGVGLDALLREISQKASQYDAQNVLNQTFGQAGIDRATFESGRDLTRGTVADAQQKSRLEALRQLSGLSAGDVFDYTQGTQTSADAGFEQLRNLISGRRS